MSASLVEVALIELARIDAPRVLSMLASRFGDLDLADDAVQDALVDATRSWPSRGVPDNPGAWLMTAARRRAIDRLRARQSELDAVRSSGPELATVDAATDAGGTTMIDDDSSLDPALDERLRLILLCCHPSLDEATQVALTLRLVGGLSTAEIASAFVTSEATVAQRIVRAKRKIRLAAIPMPMPERIDERLDAVLGVLYLVFNEGYLSRSDGDAPVRVDLMDEAIRLCAVVAEAAPDQAEPLGLLALQRFTRARTATRFNADGDLVLLADQDRSAWDRAEIGVGNKHFFAAMTKMQPGRYQVQAAIAGVHANARAAVDTDWKQIAALYAQLEAMAPSAIVRLNRAVAVGEADGPLEALALLAEPGLDAELQRYHLYWTTLGELHTSHGDAEAARGALERALLLVGDGPERRLIELRLQRLSV